MFKYIWNFFSSCCGRSSSQQTERKECECLKFYTQVIKQQAFLIKFNEDRFNALEKRILYIEKTK